MTSWNGPRLFAFMTILELDIECVEVSLHFIRSHINSVGISVERNSLTTLEVILLFVKERFNVGIWTYEVSLLKINLNIGYSVNAYCSVDKPNAQNNNNTNLWCNPFWKLLVKELLGTIGVFFSRFWVSFLSLEWIAFLSLSGEESLTANNRVFFTAASSAAITFLFHLPSDVEYHECWEDWKTRQVQHKDAKASKETEAWESFKRWGASKEESDSIGEWGDSNRWTSMLKSNHHSFFDGPPWVCLINIWWNDKHVIDTNTNEQEWK